MSIQITARMLSGVVVLDIEGKLRFLEVALNERVNVLLAAGHRNFVLDLADVSYIDSFGLGQLITIWTSIQSKDGYFTLLRPATQVRKLLHITKLDAVFHISEDEAQAVRSAESHMAASA